MEKLPFGRIYAYQRYIKQFTFFQFHAMSCWISARLTSVCILVVVTLETDLCMNYMLTLYHLGISSINPYLFMSLQHFNLSAFKFSWYFNTLKIHSQKMMHKMIHNSYKITYNIRHFLIYFVIIIVLYTETKDDRMKNISILAISCISIQCELIWCLIYITFLLRCTICKNLNAF